MFFFSPVVIIWFFTFFLPHLLCPFHYFTVFISCCLISLLPS
jgi:hypothetical protein